MSKKVITAALAGIMSAGMVTPVLAAEGQNLDSLYKAAYDATMKAEKEKTQGSVNVARNAIKALLAYNPESELVISHVGTLSEIVDGVQQPILSQAVTSVKNMNEKPSQANINEAYTNLPEELKAIDGTSVKEYWRDYHAGLKAQIDDAQSALQKKADAAVKTAQAEKTPEAIKAAQELVTEVATSIKAPIADWAKVMQERLDAIEIYALKVTEVVRVNKTTIDVKFDKLAEELKDVTLTVKDSNGKVYEVETKAYIAKGATEASFTFKKVLDSEPTGAWLVNGVGYDATAKKVVDDVIAADSQQKLADAIKAYSAFTGYEELNVGFYYDVLVSNRDKVKTISDIQTLVINAGNENAIKQGKVKDIVESPNNVVLGQRMIDAGIKRVNKNWLDKYNAEVAGNLAITGTMTPQTKFSDIQARIDKINKVEANSAVAKVLNETTELVKVNETISLVNEFYPEDSTEDKNAKKLLLDQLQIQKALSNIAAATTPESVINALKQLSNDNKEFGYAKYVNENLGVEYLTAIKKENNKLKLNTTSTLERLLEDTTDTAIEMALGNPVEAKEGLKQVINKIEVSADKKINEQEVKSLEAALDKLAKATSLKTDKHTKVFDLSKVNKNLYVQYVEKLQESGMSFENAENINVAIKHVNEHAVSTLFTDIKENENYDSKKLLAALNNATENFGLKNVKKANDGLYAANGSLFEKSALTAATNHKNVDTELQALQLRVDEVNALATMMDSESTIEETQNALKDYRKLIGKDDNNNNDKVIGGNISSQQLADVAQLINQDLKDDKAVNTLEKLNDRITSKITKHAKVMAELNSVLTKNKNQSATVNFESAKYSFNLATSATESEVKENKLTISKGGVIDLTTELTASGKALDGYTLKDITTPNAYQAKLGVIEIIAEKADAAIEANKEIKVTIDVRGTVGSVDYATISKALADIIPGADIAEAEQVLNGYIKDRTDKNDSVLAANYTNFEQVRNLMK